MRGRAEAKDLLALEGLIGQWQAAGGKSERQAAWDERKARLAQGAARAARRMERLGFGPASAGRFLGLFSLDGLLALRRLRWVDPSFRQEIARYALGLGQELEGEISDRSQERHEWMRFEVAQALLGALGRSSGEAAIEAAVETVEWESVPRGLGEWAARRQRELLSAWAGRGKSREGRRL